MANLETFVIKGTLKFPKLTTPESFNNTTNSFVTDYENGDYSTMLELVSSDPATKKWQEDLKKIQQNLLTSLKSSKKYPDGTEYVVNDIPVSIGKNKDGTPTGNMDFRFKRAAINKKGENVTISAYTALKEEIPQEELKKISGGSVANLAFCVYGWDKKTKDLKTKVEYIEFGISLCLLSVQVLKAVKGGSGADFFNIETEELDRIPDEDEVPF